MELFYMCLFILLICRISYVHQYFFVDALGGFFKQNLREDLREMRGNVSVWILSGLCKQQVEDFSYCHLEII